MYIYTFNKLISKWLISITSIILIFSSTNIIAQSDWEYISPIPNSEFINPENNIAFRNGCNIDESTVDINTITVSGSKSGIIDGEIRLSNDRRTLIFLPNNPYQYGEIITANLVEGVKTVNNVNLGKATTKFKIKQSDSYVNEPSSYQQFTNNKNTLPENNTVIFTSENLIHYGSASLPDNYPIPEILTFENPSDKYTFYGVEPKSDKYGYYATIIDNYGTPIFFREWPSKTPNFQVVANNQLVHKNSEDNVFDPNSFVVLNDKYEITDTLRVGNGYKTNTHDMIMLENGNHYLMIYDAQPVGMDTVVEGGNPNATVKGFVLQELDSDHNVIFQWRSWDHYNITDAVGVDLTAATIDYVHVNAYDTTSDGNILLCCRHFNEVTKINRNTGEIMWRFGPKAKNNMFEFSNDTMGFTYAHDVQQLANGNITLYDNGNLHNPNFSRSVEYEIDEENLTATLVWEYSNDPVIYAGAKGGSRRLDNGNTLIGWGNTFPIIATEASQDGIKQWELSTDSCLSYRVMKFDWKTSLFETNIEEIDFGYYNGYEPWPVIFSITNNADYNIEITSASNHSEAYYLETALPVQIPANGSLNMIVNFFPEWMGEQDFEDVLTLNYDGYFADTLRQRISRQIKLLGTTIDHSSIDNVNAANISIYPNPAKDFITIESHSGTINEISVFNSIGIRLDYILNIGNQKFNMDLSDYKSGIYLIKVSTNNTSKYVTSRIIVE